MRRHNRQILCSILIISVVAVLVQVPAIESLSKLVGTESLNLILTIQTERPYYGPEETVVIQGYVTDANGTPFEGAKIAVEVKDPRNNTIFLDIIFSSYDGSFEDIFKLNTNTILGDYYVYSTANAAGYLAASGQTMFAVVTTADLSEESSTESTLTETLLVHQTTMNDVVVGGNLTGTLDHANFEIASITTGSFAGKGFSKGEWNATLEGIPYTGTWRGMLYLEPSERKIYLKGSVSGEVTGIVDGYLIETVSQSGVYDRYLATWAIGRLRTTIVSATLSLNGTLVYQSSSEYPATELRVLQVSVAGSASGHYNCSLSSTLTHVEVSGSSAYSGEGFSLTSYSSTYGMGEGWTFAELAAPQVVEMQGYLTSPLYGIVYATLDETTVPRSLRLYIERVDLGLPPMADLKVRAWGPERVSPGQTIDYIIEYKNDGLKSAEDAIVVCRLPYEVEYVSSTNGSCSEATREVIWHLGFVPPKSVGVLIARVRVLWGLSGSTSFGIIVSTPKDEVEIQIDPSITLDMDAIEGNDEYLECNITVSNQTDTSTLFLNTTRAIVQEAVEPTLAYNETADTIEVELEFSMPSNSYAQIIGKVKMDAKILLWLKAAYKLGDLTFGYVKNQDFLDWTLSGNLVSPDYYEALSEWNAYSTIFKYAVKFTGMLFGMVITFPVGSIIGLAWDAVILEKIDTWAQRKLEIAIGKAIYEHSGGMVPPEWYKDSAFEDLFYSIYLDAYGLYLKEVSHGVFWHICEVIFARDPNVKYGPERYVSAGQTLNYTVECENEGEGIAFGVYFTDTLDEDLDDSTLEIGPVISTTNGSVLAGPGAYNPSTRTITWLVGEVGPGEGGMANFSAKVRNDAPEGTEIINSATVYFPSVPETTRTNAIFSVVGRPDIAIRDLAPIETSAESGSTAYLNVTIANEGYYPETVNMTFYANSTQIITHNITIAGGTENSLIFAWNTTGVPDGNYAIAAYALPVLGETDVTDNSYTCEVLQVIPEFLSLLILSPFMIVTLLALIVHRKRGIKNRKTNSDDAT